MSSKAFSRPFLETDLPKSSLLRLKLIAVSPERPEMAVKSACPRLPLLHIESSRQQRRSLQRAVRSSSVHFRVYGARDLDSAAPHFLFRPLHDKNGRYARPRLILIGYDVGIHTAADFLYWLRVQNRTTSIPVVVYSSSFAPEDVLECYAGGASQFLRRPTEFRRMMVMVKILDAAMSQRNPQLEWLERLPEYQRRPESHRCPDCVNVPFPSACLEFIENRYGRQ